MTKIDGPSHGPLAGDKPGHLVVLLHGYGADGNDLIGLAPVLAPLMPDVGFHAPNAPYPCEGNPMGYQWFGISRLDPAVAAAGVRSAAPFVDTFLDDTMAKYGLDESKTVLVGFSQGTMMALHVGLRRTTPLAGIIGFSGMLAAADALGTEIKSRPPVLLLHGDSDEMLPHHLTERATEVLRQHGVKTAMHIAQGVGHGIDQTGLSHAARFLLEAFKLPMPPGQHRTMKIGGTCKRGFERIAEAFERNFGERGEVGASVSATVAGETVVDLWGGLANPETNAPWTKDTVGIVFSCTKGATALCAHLLASGGKLDLDAPVTELWPEFGQNGKERVTTRMMLDHSAGVPALREKVKDSGPYEWDYMTERLAAEEPFWVPGTRNGYHGFTFGWTVGEMVRRASGKSLGTFFQDEIARPLGLDFWIGLPEAIEPRVAPMIPYIYKPAQTKTPFMTDLSKVPTSPASLFFFNVGAWRTGGANTRAGHAAEIGAANGITNARGLAGLYAPLAQGGGKLVDGKTLARMGEVSMATHDDATLRIPTRFALGFMKSMDNRKRSEGAKIFGPDIDSVIMSSAAFGHVGAGGSLGFADPAAGMSFGYTMNRMGPGLLLNDRGQALVDAAYLSLGYRNKDGGVWVK